MRSIRNRSEKRQVLNHRNPYLKQSSSVSSQTWIISLPRQIPRMVHKALINYFTISRMSCIRNRGFTVYKLRIPLYQFRSPILPSVLLYEMAELYEIDGIPERFANILNLTPEDKTYRS